MVFVTSTAMGWCFEGNGDEVLCLLPYELTDSGTNCIILFDGDLVSKIF